MVSTAVTLEAGEPSHNHAMKASTAVGITAGQHLDTSVGEIARVTAEPSDCALRTQVAR